MVQIIGTKSKSLGLRKKKNQTNKGHMEQKSWHYNSKIFQLLHPAHLISSYKKIKYTGKTFNKNTLALREVSVEQEQAVVKTVSLEMG